MSVIDECKELFDSLKQLRSQIKKEEGERISKLSLKSRSEGLASQFFATLNVRLEKNSNIDQEKLNVYKDNFTRLIRLTSSNNRKSSYIEVLDSLITSFSGDVLIPLKTHPETARSTGFLEMLQELGEIPEKEYFEEAIGCAESGYRRAAAVLGWSAFVYRAHKLIEKIGFQLFNSTSLQMKSTTTGRFKRYDKTFTIMNLNEMNEVFDTDLLWVLEGMGIIDMNEHTRLKSCFDLRCQGAHPCSAPITDYNLLSFFSDIKEIVFKNQKFKI